MTRDLFDAAKDFINDGNVVWVLLFVGLVFLIFTVMNGGLLSSKRSDQRRRGKPQLRLVGGTSRSKQKFSGGSQRVDMSDPANQMNAVSQVNFRTVGLLNKSEKALFHILDELVQTHRPHLRLMAQTSLGEILQPVSQDKKKWALANASINSKRLDFAVFNQAGLLVAAIEYQGSGHYHQTTFMRDAVKREALRRAGVPFVEVSAKFDAETVKTTVLPHLPEPKDQR